MAARVLLNPHTSHKRSDKTSLIIYLYILYIFISYNILETNFCEAIASSNKLKLGFSFSYRIA